MQAEKLWGKDGIDGYRLFSYADKKIRLTAKRDGWLKIFKKIKKRLQKSLDKVKNMWYNVSAFEEFVHTLSFHHCR